MCNHYWREFLRSVVVSGCINVGSNNVAAIRDIKPNSTSTTDAEAARLNANEANRKVGPSILLRVMSGDKVQVSSDAFYSTNSPSYTGFLPIDQQIAQAITSLSGSGAGNLAMNEGTMSNLVNQSASGYWSNAISNLTTNTPITANAGLFRVEGLSSVPIFRK